MTINIFGTINFKNTKPNSRPRAKHKNEIKEKPSKSIQFIQLPVFIIKNNLFIDTFDYIKLKQIKQNLNLLNMPKLIIHQFFSLSWNFMLPQSVVSNLMDFFELGSLCRC